LLTATFFTALDIITVLTGAITVLTGAIRVTHADADADGARRGIAPPAVRAVAYLGNQPT
jgi:hypothetical protein